MAITLNFIAQLAAIIAGLYALAVGIKWYVKPTLHSCFYIPSIHRLELKGVDQNEHPDQLVSEISVPSGEEVEFFVGIESKYFNHKISQKVIGIGISNNETGRITGRVKPPMENAIVEGEPWRVYIGELNNNLRIVYESPRPIPLVRRHSIYKSALWLLQRKISFKRFIDQQFMGEPLLTGVKAEFVEPGEYTVMIKSNTECGRSEEKLTINAT